MADIAVTLDSLNSGALNDLFTAEFDKVLQNISDPNTKPDAVREITMSVKIKPDKTRSMCTSIVSMKSKLVPIMPHESIVHLARKNGKLGAYIDDAQQLNLYSNPAVASGNAETHQ